MYIYAAALPKKSVGAVSDRDFPLPHKALWRQTKSASPPTNEFLGKAFTQPPPKGVITLRVMNALHGV
jgi:hypothetical protein